MTMDELIAKWSVVLTPRCRFKKGNSPRLKHIMVGRQTGKSYYTKYILDNYKQL